MGFFLFFFILGFSVFCFLSYKFRNPYRLYYVFGKKGSGKSLFMVKFILNYLKKGWKVYTDIPDLNIEGVNIINVKDLDTFRPDYHSALFLDEVGISFDNRKFKTFSDGTRDFFKFQRKYKVVCYMNSQSFDVDKKIRDLIDHFYLATSIGNVFSLYRPIDRKITLVEATSQGESRVADNLKFAPFWEWKIIYMPKYFKYFNSFEAPYREIIPSVMSSGFSINNNKNVLRELQKAFKR